jgi:hypothetical protein
VNPAAYRRKPCEVTAMRLITKDDLDKAWMWVNNNGGKASQNLSLFGGPDQLCLNIRTSDGTIRASIGDWVIQAASGEFFPVRHDIFTNTYEQVAP